MTVLVLPVETEAADDDVHLLPIFVYCEFCGTYALRQGLGKFVFSWNIATEGLQHDFQLAQEFVKGQAADAADNPVGLIAPAHEGFLQSFRSPGIDDLLGAV